MEHLYYDLGQQPKGAIAIVTLDKQANVRLMTGSDYQAFKSGRDSRFYGGRATRSPVPLEIPRTDRWYVVIDLGGLPGQVRASVQVQAPPPGLLPPLPEPRRRHRPLDVEVREPHDPVDDQFGGQTWDVFLSHASEDKQSVAVPLRDALTARGVTVWLDRTEIRIGDSLRRKIDAGIRSSRVGIVVLSEAFFNKGWTNHELDGLVTRTVAGEQSLLPIWHGVDATDVRRYSPSLADKAALSTSDVAIDEIAQQIADVVLDARLPLEHS